LPPANPFGNALADYRRNILNRYTALADEARIGPEPA
jgi:hypothetical protein